MYIIVLIIVLSSLSTMFLCFQYEKEKTSDKKTIKPIYIYISSFLMGALGSIFAMIGFNFEVKNKKFVLTQIIFLIIQVIIIAIVYPKIK
ncbi:hypothetical protein [Haploplasma axanthum]|uniref:DUF1294 domain-containing protein n=1 Tax=Haploplasma axanthum TaxID=29552 RepID=A0A449BBM8_HAPAX|nr:hypothetical protein [Haploplasma axanthum]VEU79853.1 Uncharacterised protein [Haploplasma axanthum]